MLIASLCFACHRLTVKFGMSLGLFYVVEDNSYDSLVATLEYTSTLRLGCFEDQRWSKSSAATSLTKIELTYSVLEFFVFIAVGWAVEL